jgi:transcriptional regulator of arginine metabolism
MSDARTRRQKAIADLIRSASVGSQEEVTERLGALGFNVTQATVSRDLDQIGAVKVKRGGAMSYALPDQIAEGDWASDRLQRLLREWVLSVEPAAGLIVIKTPPGSAQIVAFAFDQAKLPEIAGTLSGDDTIFLALRDAREVGRMTAELRKLAGATERSVD